MIILLSPSKTQDFETPTPPETPHSFPHFQTEIAELVEKFKKLSPKQLAKKLDISQKLAALNHERYQNFKPKFNTKTGKQAFYAFQGDVYKNIAPSKYTKLEMRFAQKHIRIISGLYGLLKPLDLIQPYRLEMKTKGQYSFWDDKITLLLQDQLKDSKGPIINLASQEYFKVVQPQKLKTEIITPVFKEKAKRMRSIALYSKIARGTMANYIVKNRILKARKLKEFNLDGYEFDPERSTETEWVFVR